MQGLGITDMKQLDMKSDMGKVADTIAASDETGQAEDWGAISTRLRTALDEISEKRLRTAAATCLSFLMAYRLALSFKRLILAKFPAGLENASVTKIIYKDGTYQIESVGDMSYAEKAKKQNKTINTIQQDALVAVFRLRSG